jgi:hypothetical protein
MAFTYGGKFEKHINEMYRPGKIADTARLFKEFESKYGTYSFGDNFTKTLVPRPEDWADNSGSTDGYKTWEKNSGGIPESIRKQITEVIATNLRSDHPLPLVLKVGENVDASHELIVKAFAHEGQMYIGLHILCPNSALAA